MDMWLTALALSSFINTEVRNLSLHTIRSSLLWEVEVSSRCLSPVTALYSSMLTIHLLSFAEG